MIPAVPIVHELEQDDTANFRFVHGAYEVPPPQGYTEFFGPPPHYSFYPDVPTEIFERTGINQDAKQIGDTPEETMRNLFPLAKFRIGEDFQQDLDRLNAIVDSEGPFEAILGFSHGACIAATVLEDNIRKSRANGVPSMFKLGIFLCGVPPYNMRTGGLLLADTDGIIFQLPTIHVIGSNDPLIHCALALYNVCDPDTAEIFDHGRGHQLVW